MAPREPRRSACQRGYTKRWDAAAKHFRLLYPLCGMRPHGQAPVMSECYMRGRTTAGKVTDHVRPHYGDQVLFWDSEYNWQSLCADCHLRKTKAGL